jgi:hypothetical protein
MVTPLLRSTAPCLPPDRYGVLLRIGRRDMKFVVVNGRTPRPQAFCVMCDQPIRASYLREMGTQLIYCDHDCYADHCESAFRVLENRARAS